mgnify:CR=1 FL=1
MAEGDEIVNAVIVSGSIKKLSNTIEKLDKQNTKLNKSIFWLTVIATLLALIQIFPIFLKTYL